VVEAEQVTTSPFIWAQDVPLDRLCICQMGAKPVPYDELKGGPELGEEYTIIGQRSLEFSPEAEQGL
jgi:activating signal cointegrator complex subunit 1